MAVLTIRIKWFLRWIGRFLEFFIFFIHVYLLVIFWGMIIPSGNEPTGRDYTLFVRSNGVHTDLCMPTQTADYDWTSFIPLSHFEDITQTEYIAIGWGDKGFFLDTPTWAELKVSTAINAAFLPSPTAMHVEYMSVPKVSSDIKQIQISSKDYQKLIRFIQHSFVQTRNGISLIPDRGYWKRDNFYDAHGNYHLFNTCNVWVNDALKSAELPTSLLSILPEGNLRHL